MSSEKKTAIIGWLTFIVLFIAIVPIASSVAVLNKSSDTAADRKITISMAGFSPNIIKMQSGEPLSIELVNPDNSAHSDGGGWHQFASEELGFDYKIAPESNQIIELKIGIPGEYQFYCGICCGGKENPAMQGTIIVS